MRKFAVALGLGLGVLALAVPAGAQAGRDDHGGHGITPAADPVPSQYIVTLRTPPAASDAAASALTAKHGGRVERTYSHALSGYAARLTPAQAEELSGDPSVASVEQD